MVRAVLAATIVASAAVAVQAQSASAPLIVTATVVSTCRVDVPTSVDASAFPTVPVAVTCARGSIAPRVQRPLAPQRSDVRDGQLVINF